MEGGGSTSGRWFTERRPRQVYFCLFELMLVSGERAGAQSPAELPVAKIVIRPPCLVNSSCLCPNLPSVPSLPPSNSSFSSQHSPLPYCPPYLNYTLRLLFPPNRLALHTLPDNPQQWNSSSAHVKPPQKSYDRINALSINQCGNWTGNVQSWSSRRRS